MYKFFRNWYRKQINAEIIERLNKERDEYFRQGLEKGYSQREENINDLIDTKARDLYAQNNFLVNPNHIFQVSKQGIPYLGLEPITKDKVRNLQQQAKQLLDSELWPILTTLIRDKAVDLAVKTSQNWDNVFGGKMMVHNISLIENLVKYIATVDIDKIPVASGNKEQTVV